MLLGSSRQGLSLPTIVRCYGGKDCLTPVGRNTYSALLDQGGIQARLLPSNVRLPTVQRDRGLHAFLLYVPQQGFG